MKKKSNSERRKEQKSISILTLPFFFLSSPSSSQVKNGNSDALVTKYGEVSASEYQDPRGGTVFTFDHIRQQVTGSRPIGGDLDGQVEPFR